MAENIVEWLRQEVDKRLGPWVATNAKGDPEPRAALCTCIVIKPTQAMELLALAERGKLNPLWAEHSPGLCRINVVNPADSRKVQRVENVETRNFVEYLDGDPPSFVLEYVTFVDNQPTLCRVSLSELPALVQDFLMEQRGPDNGQA